MQTDTTAADAAPQHDHNDGFEDLRAAMQRHIVTVTEHAASPHLYRTDATGLYDAFLAALPEHRRQHYACRTCRRFVDQYGGLVLLDVDGRPVGIAVWPNAAGMSTPLGSAVDAVVRIVGRAQIVGTFSDTVDPWGTPSAGARADGTPWTHLSVSPPSEIIGAAFPPRNLTPHQAEAEKTADRQILERSLAEFRRDAVAQAHGYLKSGQLYRSEVAEKIAEWLLALHDKLAANKHTRCRSNLIWQAVATAPAGWCHVRSSMLGTLLEDVVAGLPFADLSARWSAKMDPHQYQRPQASPTAGNVRRAEQVFADLGLAPALRRRFARLEDIAPHALWLADRPAAKDKPSPVGGVFGHVRTKSDAPTPARRAVDSPPVTLTFDKFRRTVLGSAVSIEFMVPSGTQPFAALVTAADPTAPPIVQWDDPGERNPITWYIHGSCGLIRTSGSEASAWRLQAHTLAKVTAICLGPHMWRGEDRNAHHGNRAFILLDGARDVRNERGGGLFPSHLRGELREVRATIEAHANAAAIEGRDEASACGLMLQAGVPWSCSLRVVDRSGVVTTYKLDRWD